MPSYPQPAQPVFNERNSCTFIPTASSSSSSSASDDSTTPTASPTKITSTFLDQSRSPYSHASDFVPSPSHISSPPSFYSVDILKEPEYSRASSDRLELSDSSSAEEGEAAPLLAERHGAGGVEKWYEGPLFVTGVKLSLLFIIFTGLVVGTFWFGMPKLDPEDRGTMKIPRSFADLQALNSLFQKYKQRFPFRILACGVVSYLFVQAFSLPGSMYISILFGAAYGMIYGLLLSCVCEASGALLCYLLSALLAPPLLALPFYRARVETWRVKIMGDPKKGKEVSWDGVFAFLVVLRIAPFPPHWVANFVAPHLGIGMGLFFSSVFIGIAPVSVIHVTIGSSLDSMTSADDFHVLSLKNVLGLIAVGVAVLIPVGLKRVFRKDLGDLSDVETALAEESVDTQIVDVPPVDDNQPRRYQAIDSGVVLAGPSAGDPNFDSSAAILPKGKGRALEILADIRDNDDGDVVLYDVDQAHAHVKVDKAVLAGAHLPIKGYGAIESVGEEYPTNLRTIWPFSRS
ncbi:MAG: hypothetical protein TREMPRED_002076 [Tremellales sp. Tagirdzhanova-0007]|nr:MAG: hypothetical protein TREMPRED_002076 [Tremellales sp. Tagirdzhanova-0007]